MAAISSTAYFASQPRLPAPTASPSSGGGGEMVRTRRSSSFVMVEAAAPSRSGGGVVRTKSLTEEDLADLKGCLDLGFGFAYHEIPELCGTLPALELCYSMTRRFLDEQGAPGLEQEPEATSLPNWRISGPGDDPEEVKARLKYWAQAVACTVKLCS
ncbi:hypothetical protein PR202_ga08759 [Eleusine coracana subsp. coracana]|uniref:Uncharacterized protein n=1 Tax=Eleusine coracana subsp. coracana TaxID=191504 RepID=A0AAV5C2J5_ELECO|nr:hypothetical protein QOZ80_1AG0043150 [Eleusine coracana subsp. coracana]GJM92299.1 hypothetical protein PR202_ga08759 [Eleusine coracana subsp. coracana]